MRFLINPLLLLPRANNLFTSRRRRRCVVDDDESITATTTKTSAIPGIHKSLLKRNPIQVFFHRILVGNVSLYTALGQHKSVMKRLILSHPPQPEIAINHAGVVTEIDGRGASSFASVRPPHSLKFLAICRLETYYMLDCLFGSALHSLKLSVRDSERLRLNKMPENYNTDYKDIPALNAAVNYLLKGLVKLDVQFPSSAALDWKPCHERCLIFSPFVLNSSIALRGLGSSATDQCPVPYRTAHYGLRCPAFPQCPNVPMFGPIRLVIPLEVASISQSLLWRKTFNHPLSSSAVSFPPQLPSTQRNHVSLHSSPRVTPSMISIQFKEFLPERQYLNSHDNDFFTLSTALEDFDLDSRSQKASGGENKCLFYSERSSNYEDLEPDRGQARVTRPSGTGNLWLYVNRVVCSYSSSSVQLEGNWSDIGDTDGYSRVICNRNLSSVVIDAKLLKSSIVTLLHI
ncbi:hypothetical protein RRG08_059049 [Elysia crispata]|uniref:Uncharacterized protein n=1 Tax=Elysia crispata TaxID=231223 RepID=A0AAE0ZDK9_9GAST|nr:hypothetical protein RRG08_059049 [Elysia crispata]